MKKKTFLKNQFILNTILVAVLISGVLLSMNRYRNYREYTFYNNARILVTDQLKKVEEIIEKSDLQSLKMNSFEYPFVITDINGNILYSSNDDYKINNRVTINEFIQIDQSFFLNNSDVVKVTFVLKHSNNNFGFIAFFIPRDKAIGIQEWQVILNMFSPIIIACFIVVLLVFINYKYMKRRVINPVHEMISSSKAIIQGDYDIPVIGAKNEKLMNNDIEMLSYNFELMRDELNEKRRREEQLKRNQKELISCISHDLKTPISTIKAYSEGLRDGMANTDEKVQKYSNIIVAKTEVLSKMISDLLEHFNAELNQLSIIKKEQYFNDFIDELSKELREVVLHNKMDFHYENTAPSLLINFDENRITQVIANLVDNSIKYGKEVGGRIEILVKYLQDKKQIIIKVSDNGNGIGAMDIPYVFDKFYRGEKSRNMSIPGSGLGLSICKYIIEQHDGEIICESKKSEGTDFIISIPV